MAADNTDVRYLDMTHCDLEWVGKLEGRRELGGEHRGQISVRWAVIGPERPILSSDWSRVGLYSHLIGQALRHPGPERQQAEGEAQ